MKLYKIVEMKNVDCKYMVVATSYVSPLDKVREIEHDLGKFNYKGNVVLDLLLCNGFSKNRFVQFYFDGKELAVDGDVIENINELYKIQSSRLFRENPQWLEKSILVGAQRFLVKKGRVC